MFLEAGKCSDPLYFFSFPRGRRPFSWLSASRSWRRWAGALAFSPGTLAATPLAAREALQHQDLVQVLAAHVTRRSSAAPCRGRRRCLALDDGEGPSAPRARRLALSRRPSACRPAWRRNARPFSACARGTAGWFPAHRRSTAAARGVRAERRGSCPRRCWHAARSLQARAWTRVAAPRQHK